MAAVVEVRIGSRLITGSREAVRCALHIEWLKIIEKTREGQIMQSDGLRSVIYVQVRRMSK